MTDIYNNVLNIEYCCASCSFSITPFILWRVFMWITKTQLPTVFYVCMSLSPIIFLSLFVYSGKPTFWEQPRSLQGTDPFSQMFHSPRWGLGHNYTATLQIRQDVSECEENTGPPVWLGVGPTWKLVSVHRLLAMCIERLSSRSSSLSPSQSVCGATFRPDGGNKPHNGVSLILADILLNEQMGV